MTLKLSITEGDQIVENVVQDANTDPAELSKALNVFRERINTLFTKKLIAHSQSSIMNSSDNSSDDENTSLSPKKKKR
ncbi:unnamed protein product [Pieris brassicae]|uniref:Uncharacterized protein n=1 Tax=Pieris brassicae TaxID=7116 RepID=A0A9P0TNH7_PIEBR|nr:unnamed protein product [Pieris brassicae]